MFSPPARAVFPHVMGNVGFYSPQLGDIVVVSPAAKPGVMLRPQLFARQLVLAHQPHCLPLAHHAAPHCCVGLSSLPPGLVATTQARDLAHSRCVDGRALLLLQSFPPRCRLVFCDVPGTVLGFTRTALAERVPRPWQKHTWPGCPGRPWEGSCPDR